MRRYLHFSLVVLCSALFLASCSKVPEHAKHIPEDATIVIGVNLKAMGKKIAWNAILGSKLLDEITDKNKGSKKEEMASGLDNAGIDAMNTLYLYQKKDTRYAGDMRITALIPLSDAAKWEAYIQKSFPGVKISTAANRKEALLADNMYAGWDSKLLVIMNTPDAFRGLLNKVPGQSAIDEALADSSVAVTDDATAGMVSVPDERTAADPAVLTAEMENAFAVKKENSLVNNKRFSSLEKTGHDITFFVNYSALMDSYMNKGGLNMMASGMMSSLWKETYFTSGVDFLKGQIRMEMKYYPSDSLKRIIKELVGEHVDKEMVERLPKQNSNMSMAWHFSPKGMKGIFEKTGLVALADMMLMKEGLSVETILTAFSGDMVMSLNNFSVTKGAASVQDSLGNASASSSNYEPKLDYLYALKIGKKENFDKVLQYAVKQEILVSKGDNKYGVGNNDKLFISVSKDYLIAAQNQEAVDAYLSGANKSQKLSESESKALLGHPFGMYVNFQAFASAWTPEKEEDRALLEETKKLLDYADFYGGEFTSDAQESHAELNFRNKEENSLIILLNYLVHVKNLKNNTAAPAASAN